MIRLIASDIDGTLVPDGANQLNPEIYEVIRRLSEERGIRFVCASGRQYASIRRLFAPVQEEVIYLAEGGGLILEHGQVLASEPMEWETVHELVRDVRTMPDCDVVLCGEKRAYADRNDSRMFRWLKEDYLFDVEAVGDLSAPIDDNIVKVSLYHPDRAEEVFAAWITPKWEKRLQVSCAGIQWMDCMNPGISKGSALKRLQERFCISPEETMAFGDNLNDLEMLSLAGQSYAVANAREEVRRAARFRADSNRNDGVLKELKKLLSNPRPAV